MDARGSLLLHVVDGLSFRDPVKTPHHDCMDETDRPVDVVVRKTRNQHLFTLLYQVVLNCANVLDVGHVLVETWVDGHMLGTHGEPLTVLVFAFNVEHEGDARGILGHHFL